MRVIAIGDAHIRVADRRHATRMRALEQIRAHAEAIDADLIVWPGDLFDRESEIGDRNELRAYFKALARICPVLACRGNHDVNGDGDFLADLRTSTDLWYVTTPQVVVVPTARGPIAVAALPYPDKSSLIAAGLPATEIGAAVHRALDAIFIGLGAELARHDAAGTPTLFIGHVTVGGAELSVGQLLLGHDLAIDATHLSRLPASTTVVLNHIHKPQTIYGAHYVGSVCAMNWGEAEAKRFLVLEQVEGAWQVESVPLDVPRLYHVDGQATREGFDWQVRKGPEGTTDVAPPTWAGCEVRVRYRVPASDLGAMPFIKAQILAEFADAAHLELEPVAVAEREVRAPEVLAAQTLDGKVRAWAAAAGVTTPDSVLAKLAFLESLDAEAVLALVQESVARPEGLVAA